MKFFFYYAVCSLSYLSSSVLLGSQTYVFNSSVSTERWNAYVCVVAWGFIDTWILWAFMQDALLQISQAQCKLFWVCVWEENGVESGHRASRSGEADTLCGLHRAASSIPPHPITALSRSTCLLCAVSSRQTDRAALTSSLTPDTNTHIPSCQTHTGQVQTLALHHWHVEYSRRKETNCCF